MKHISRLVVLVFSICLVFSPAAQSEALTAKECAQLVWDIIETEYSDFFEPVSIDYSETRLVVYVKTEGLEQQLHDAYQKGYGQHYPPWVEYKKCFLAAYQIIQATLEENGRGDFFFELWLCNDKTLGSIFIKYLTATCDGEYVAHDVMWRSDEIYMDEVPNTCDATSHDITIDLSVLSYDELVALKDQINLAIWNSQEWQEVTVPQGVWKVGEDIPAGTWTVICATEPGWRSCYFTWGENLEPNGQDVEIEWGTRYDFLALYNPNHKYYEVGDGVTSYTFTVRNGDYIVIEDAPAVFTPYAGKPDLGFK